MLWFLLQKARSKLRMYFYCFSGIKIKWSCGSWNCWPNSTEVLHQFGCWISGSVSECQGVESCSIDLVRNIRAVWYRSIIKDLNQKEWIRKCFSGVLRNGGIGRFEDWILGSRDRGGTSHTSTSAGFEFIWYRYSIQEAFGYIDQDHYRWNISLAWTNRSVPWSRVRKNSPFDGVFLAVDPHNISGFLHSFRCSRLYLWTSTNLKCLAWDVHPLITHDRYDIFCF